MTSVTSPPVVVEVVVVPHRNNSDDGINDTTNRMRRELLSYRKARVINDDYIHGNSTRLTTTRSNGGNRTRRVVTNDCMTKCETRSTMANESVHRMKQHLINYQKGKCLSISM